MANQKAVYILALNEVKQTTTKILNYLFNIKMYTGALRYFSGLNLRVGLAGSELETIRAYEPGMTIPELLLELWSHDKIEMISLLT